MLGMSWPAEAPVTRGNVELPEVRTRGSLIRSAEKPP
jgi:hypothetical protein